MKKENASLSLDYSQTKGVTWQVDLAELNLHVDHSTASTLSPQLIFLISQSFLDNCQLLIGVWSSWKVTCRFCRPRRKQVGSCLGSSWDKRGHGNWNREKISSSSRKRSTTIHSPPIARNQHKSYLLKILRGNLIAWVPMAVRSSRKSSITASVFFRLQVMQWNFGQPWGHQCTLKFWSSAVNTGNHSHQPELRNWSYPSTWDYKFFNGAIQVANLT